uniref:Calx-beta domain-containing protein n=1 Tax=Panagrolaimus sp. JU765 TaxID=591449 RepID=A0AC34RN84_9BILA
MATEKIVKETPKSRAFYRIQATHKMMGAGDLTLKTEKAIRKKSQELINEMMPHKPKQVTVEFDPANYMCLENIGVIPIKVKCDRGSLEVPTKVTVHYKTYPDTAQEDDDFIPAEGVLVFKPNETEFDPANYMCLENIGVIPIKVKCDRGSLEVPTKVTVHYKTYPDTAQEDDDFIPAEGVLVFKPNETEKTIEIGIVDNDVYEDDEQFFVRLTDLKAVCYTNEEQTIKAVLGPADEATVLIIDDDHGGAFSFDTELYKVPENQGVFVLEVRRHRGARGKVRLPYKTVDGLAKNGEDYIGHDGELIFEDSQTL